MQYNMAILGAGHIAGKMAEAMCGLTDLVKPYAVASRSIEKASAFREQWGFEKAYGSYEELVNDDSVDLIYVATPHSHHYAHAKLCIEHGKACLVEKAFTANAVQAKDLIALARSKGVFLTEAIWTRYMPARHIVKEILASGMIGEVQSLKAEFSMNIADKQRMHDPALAGGALLDLGMYALTFASMYFGNAITKVESNCVKYETGVDATDDIYYTYADGKKAHLRTSMVSETVNEGTIYGVKGSIYVETLNNYSKICTYDLDGKCIREYAIPEQINGYEYEVIACVNALKEGLLSCAEMPHEETIELMRQMDFLRKQWDVVYPFE